MSVDKPLIVHVVGHPKSGTRWMCSVLSTYFDIPITAGPLIPRPEIPANPVRHDKSRVIHSHIFYPDARDPSFPVADYTFYMVRDIRDVMVSWFHHYRRIPFLPPVSNLADFIHNVYLKEYIHHFGRWDDHIHDWTSRDTPYVKYEELTADPFNTFRRLFVLEGIDVDDEKLAATVEKSSIGELKKSGMSFVGMDVTTEHFRKGVSGEWKKEMNENDTLLLLEMYGHTMEEWGYIDSGGAQTRGVTPVTRNDAVNQVFEKYPYWRENLRVADGVILGDGDADTLAESLMEMTAPLIESVCPDGVDKASVFVAGCGQGYFTRALAGMGFARVAGMESYTKWLEMARIIYAAGIEYINGDFEKIGQADFGIFDITFMPDQLGWLKNPAMAFRTMARITNKMMIISGDVLPDPGRKTVIKNGRKYSSSQSPSPYIAMSKPSVVSLLRECDFAQVTQILPTPNSHADYRNFGKVALACFKNFLPLDKGEYAEGGRGSELIERNGISDTSPVAQARRPLLAREGKINQHSQGITHDQ